ncbi:hypothetical protein T08_6194 [Trichinella sp. T8]|nr:hypothetical protein T08_6194 [Trichinella sp. T8]
MDRISSISMWIFPSPSKVCPRKRKVSVAHREGISELIPVFQSLMLNLAAGLTKVLRLRGDLEMQRIPPESHMPLSKGSSYQLRCQPPASDHRRKPECKFFRHGNRRQGRRLGRQGVTLPDSIANRNWFAPEPFNFCISRTRKHLRNQVDRFRVDVIFSQGSYNP